MPNCPTCGHRLKASKATGLAFPKLGKRKGRGCRTSDRDEAARERLGYVEAGSIVRLDGSEKLVGLDWEARKMELSIRSGGRCEHVPHKQEFIEGIGWLYAGINRCPMTARDADHIIKRSLRRDDRLSNLQHLCAIHHDLKHPEFKTQFGKKS